MVITDKHGGSNATETALTRRKMLAASSALLAAGAAGCLSGGEDDDGEDGANGGGEAETITTWTSTIPGEMNLNSMASGFPWDEEWIFFEQITTFYADGEVEHELVEDWEYDNDDRTLTVEFADGWYWWNGDQVTAEDIYWTDMVSHHSNPEISQWEDLELVDEMTIVRTFKEEQNPIHIDSMVSGAFGETVRGHRDWYEPWAERLAEASDQEERAELQDELAEEMPIHLSTAVEEGLGNGPYAITEFDEQSIRLELNDDHPYADEMDIPRLEIILAADDALAQRILGGDIDFGSGLLETHIGDAERPDHLDDVVRYDDTYMRNVKFYEQGPGEAHMRTLEVRRAIAHVLDNPDISENYATPSTPREAQTGMTAAVTETFFDDEFIDDFIDYPYQADEDGAIDLMESAGYELDGDDWVDEDGDRVELEMVIPDRHTNIARTVVDQLNEFGFTVDLNVLEGATYNDRRSDVIDWDLTVGEHGGMIAHPWYYFRLEHQHSNDFGEIDVAMDAIEEGETRTPYNGRQTVVDLPTEVGQEDPSGSTEEVNLVELYNEWWITQTDERNQEIAETFAWWFNYYVPMVDLVELETGSFGNTRDFQFDTETNDWQTYRGDYRALRRGRITAGTD
ncbi:ABC transporter substrate-binding protein [Natrononativus amylolyticus]|uniref:ABC transporter substrate-binding protein n=1 Tax=Natrononativus amylolyticus TaxID=2963434 RepID=UPI0020CD32D5|nr:ABC transporter substrate-binding protein [Natrononativus amylolyticus]